jgi:hypothetical protein
MDADEEYIRKSRLMHMCVSVGMRDRETRTNTSLMMKIMRS